MFSHVSAYMNLALYFRHCIVRDKATKLEEIQKCTLKLSALPFVVSLSYITVNVLNFLFSIKMLVLRSGI